MIDFKRLQFLSNKVKANTANQQEKDEYMLILYQNRSITKSQYEKYIKDKNNSENINAAITIGGILLLGYLLDKLINTNSKK
ncbi:hypothetical protein [Flavobacterium sp. NRK F7]|uniref:hypothetical protein n=1 Tax=Flavobacterium sp. NRK F7 TaxID=2954930 RepID=UPI00209195EF|nr:hypothetical protein [Flavobacterium sp. NRK F7]MCO6163696.1 hypothetical protein [Flavobacterium sp. NRK F7]